MAPFPATISVPLCLNLEQEIQDGCYKLINGKLQKSPSKPSNGLAACVGYQSRMDRFQTLSQQWACSARKSRLVQDDVCATCITQQLEFPCPMLRRARVSCTVHSRLIFTAVGNLPRHPRSFCSARWRRSHLHFTGRTDRFKVDLSNSVGPSLHAY